MRLIQQPTWAVNVLATRGCLADRWPGGRGESTGGEDDAKWHEHRANEGDGREDRGLG